MMVTRFRALRLYCGIRAQEVAGPADMSPQRLGQVEKTCAYRHGIAGPKAAAALKSLVDIKIERLQKAKEYIALHGDRLFDRVREGNPFE